MNAFLKSKIDNIIPSKCSLALQNTEDFKSCLWRCVFLCIPEMPAAKTNGLWQLPRGRNILTNHSGLLSVGILATKDHIPSRLPVHFILLSKCFHTLQCIPTLFFNTLHMDPVTMSNWHLLLSLPSWLGMVCFPVRDFFCWLLESYSMGWLSL